MTCNCALILAAGKGERLRPITDEIPKPLIQVGEFRLIEYHLFNLANAGIKHIYINRAHLREKFDELLNLSHYPGVKINYLDEPCGALETGGAIINAFENINTERLIVVNGDIWTDYNFNNIKSLPDNINDNAHIILTSNPAHNPQGDFSLEGSRLAKPDGINLSYTFTGIGIYRRRMFNECSVEFTKLAPLLRQQIALKTISASFTDKKWMDIGTLERLNELRLTINQAGRRD